jgi:hypothetical protein
MWFCNALRKPYDRLLLALIVARLAEQLLLYRAGFIALTADEFGRTFTAAKWAEHPYAILSGGWLPLHFYLIGLGLKLYWNLTLVPRLITISLGLVSIALEYLLGWLLTDSRPVALVGAFLLAISPAHVWLSSTPLSEIPFFICWLAALCGVTVFLRSGRVAALYGAALAMTFANGIRYEGWWISAILIFMLAIITGWRFARGITSQRRALAILGAWALVGLFPFIWLAGNFAELGDALAFARVAREYLARWYPSTKDYGAYGLALIRIDPFALVGIPLGALALALRQRNTALWCYLALTFGPLVTYLILQNGQIEPEANHLRYLALYVFALYPLMAYGLAALGARLWRGRIVRAAVGCLVVGVIVAYHLRATFAFQNDPAADGFVVGKQIAALRRSSGKPQIAIVELIYWQYLAVHAGADDVDTIWYDRPIDLASRSSRSYLLDQSARLQECFREQGVGYIAARSPEIKRAIERNFAIEATIQAGNYIVYSITVSRTQDANLGNCPTDNQP